MEGGAYGHMAHPFDDKDLTFGDLKKIIENGLGGQLNREDNVTEKLDGQNIMVSFKDGKLIAARNKGHIKNGGKTALDKKGIASKFKGRGAIRNAFVYAMNDLEKAIKSLSDKQRDKIFNNGYNFMNLEVMYPSSANVIDYDKAQIVFHGTLEYDESGTAIGQPSDSARMLAGMIKQVNQDVQKHYKIGKPQFLQVPKVQDFGKKKKVYLNRLKRNMKLQADPTIIYGLLPDFDGNITKANLKDKNNPYNTYQISGLPPTPISTISKSSLEAVILGMRNEYLYFVAKGDGTHKFSKTYEEHLEAVKKYQLN